MENKPRVFLVAHEIAKKFYREYVDTSASEKHAKYLRKKARLSRNLNREMRKA